MISSTNLTTKAGGGTSAAACDNLINEVQINDHCINFLLRQQLAKSSVKKYQAMQNAVCKDGRAHGMFQFYGATAQADGPDA